MDFYTKLNVKVQQKYDYIFRIIKTVEQIPIKYFKYLSGTNSLYEIRVEYANNQYRTLCFMDRINVILINSFIKKTKKTPNKEIDLAHKLKKNYYKNK